MSCIVALPVDILHIVKALHIVADSGTGKPVAVAGLDSLGSFLLILNLDSWE